VAAARERRRRALRFTSLIDCSTRVLRAPARMPRSLALYPNFIAFSNRNFPRNPVDDSTGQCCPMKSTTAIL